MQHNHGPRPRKSIWLKLFGFRFNIRIYTPYRIVKGRILTQEEFQKEFSQEFKRVVAQYIAEHNKRMVSND